VAQSSLATAEAFVAAINRHDADALCALMSEGHRFIDSLGAVFEGREALRAGWGSYFRMVLDYFVAVRETFDDGETVVMLGIARGTYLWEDTPRPENFWQTPAAWRARIRDGQVTEWQVYADNEPMRRLQRTQTDR